MRRKSKPKPRTNWKQRALHCEEVIKIQNVLAESREAKVRNVGVTIAMQNYELDYKGRDLVGLQDDIEKLTARAESAEKHNALLLEERNRGIICDKCGCNTSGEIENNYCDECFEAKLAPTHWQRFKSWLSRRGK